MELQIQRQIEQFLRLVELPMLRVESQMEFHLPPFQFYIECLDEHILLTLGREVELPYQKDVLKKLLTASHPARTQGTPLRVWQLSGWQMLSCAPVKESEITHWLICFQVMRRLLEITAGGNR